MLTLLFVSVLPLAFNNQPVKASGTIYIKADGSIDPPTAPIQRNGDIYTFTDDINDSIVVGRNNIIIDGAGYTLQGPGVSSYNGISLSGRSNVTIRNISIKGFECGIYIYSSATSSNHAILGNNITNNGRGIRLIQSSNNTVSGNNIANNGDGIGFDAFSNNNAISGNNITNNGCGIRLYQSSNNAIFHNNFIGNIQQVSNDGYANIWDEGYPSGGNYWSDYAGVDLYSGLYQNETGGDSVGDTPYVIDTNNQDNYPLMNPWTPTPDFSIGASPTSLTIQQGDSDSTVITLTSVNGFNQPVELSVSGAPSGIIWGFSSRVVTPPPDSSATSTLTVSVDATATPGSYILTVTGTSNILTHSVYVSLEITAPPHGLEESPWPMFQHDPQHTGRSSYTGPEKSALKWSFLTGGSVDSSPAIGADDTIYTASTDGKLYAINPGGSVKWTYAMEAYLSSPAIATDGTIYVGSDSGKFYAINPDGTLKWSYTTGDFVWSSPAIGLDGTIYVGSSDKKLYAINPDGNLKWSYTTGNWVTSSPAIGPDDTIYAGSWDFKLYALNPNGSLKWSYTTDGDIHMSSPTVGNDDTIFIGTRTHRGPVAYDGKLYAINSDGGLKWIYNTGIIHSTPAIASDGTIYVGDNDGKLYALNPDGTLKWSFSTGGSVHSSPAIAADGTIYVGSYDNKLYAINADGTLKWSYTTGDEVRSSPAIGANNTIYVGSRDGKLYTIGLGLAPENQPPVAFFTYSPAEPRSGDIVTFDARGSYDPDLYGRIIRYRWNFGDGETFESHEPDDATHRFRGAQGEPKRYEVKLTIVDNEGATATSTVYVTVAPLKKSVEVSDIAAFARMTITYNWVEKISGEDIYIISNIHVNGTGFIGDLIPSIWVWKGLPIPDIIFLDYLTSLTPTYLEKDYDRSTETPFKTKPLIGISPPITKRTFDEGTLEGIQVKASDVMTLWMRGVMLTIPKPPRFIPAKISISKLHVAVFDPQASADPNLSQIILQELLDIILNSLITTIGSPCELRIYDPQGRVTGIINGETKEEIPNSAYFNNTIIILSEDVSYIYEVVGKEAGLYTLTIFSFIKEMNNTFTASDIPILNNATHQYTVDWTALSQGEEGVTVQIDSNGDGTFEHTFTSDSELTRDEFLLKVRPSEAFPMWVVGAAALIAAIGIAVAYIKYRKRGEFAGDISSIVG